MQNAGAGSLAINFNPLPSHEGRRSSRPAWLLHRNFNPLPSHEGRRRMLNFAARVCVFQSTPLSRGETGAGSQAGKDGRYFNPLPSHEGRRAVSRRPAGQQKISIHSPLTRGDRLYDRVPGHHTYFNPLPSHEGRRTDIDRYIPMLQISIHSPLTRGDSKKRQFPISTSQIHYAILTITFSADLKLS